MNKKVESEWYLEEDLSPMNGKVWRMCKNLGADKQNVHMDMGVGERGRMNWEIGTDIYTLSCVK